MSKVEQAFELVISAIIFLMLLAVITQLPNFPIDVTITASFVTKIATWLIYIFMGFVFAFVVMKIIEPLIN